MHKSFQSIVLMSLILALSGCEGRSSRNAESKPKYPIELKIGVGLPQTTIEGTFVFFCVDCTILEDFPAPMECVWVIEPSKGDPVKIPEKIPRKKNLRAGPLWKPENGPFKSHIEDRNGKRLSESIDMLPPGI
jgi:hypothetical protein